jgi:hypothetical protein
MRFADLGYADGKSATTRSARLIFIGTYPEPET